MLNVELILLYFFSTLAVLCSIMVIVPSNAVHSILFLILVFCNMAGLLLLAGCEFFAFLLLIVYVGAIAVLFLFVIMMLNIKLFNQTKNLWATMPIGIVLFLTVMFQFVLYSETFSKLIKKADFNRQEFIDWFSNNMYLYNIETIGKVLYTNYSFSFILSGCILLISMIGVIVLTMHQRSNVKKQHISNQLRRDNFGVLKFVFLRK